ncbi:hypothetical protein Sjap_026460 [Stephania japonica]|uniref:Transmembrane protein n=1 Tax=Stephania japonica TaxID=461633 RepID=A0AAP0EBM1_9MAGN
MEALWRLEDKWKLTSQEAILLFVCSAFAVIGLCATTIVKRRKKMSCWFQARQLVNDKDESTAVDIMRPNWWPDPNSGGCSVKNSLTGYAQWSGGSKWEERESGNWKCSIPNMHGGFNVGAVGGGGIIGRDLPLEWSHNSTSPVWQRPILMGERCELPRFSGLILYDEQGHPLHHAEKEKTVKVVTILRDLL